MHLILSFIENNFQLICLIWISVALLTFVLLQFVTAPYGRHIQKGWGITVSNKTGWIFMELPSFLLMSLPLAFAHASNYAIFLNTLWIIHYFNRTWIFPFRIRTKGKRMPLIIVASAIFFNFINAGLNASYFGFLENYPDGYFYQWPFYVGITLFIVGFIINQISDSVLINLRKPGETNYRIPKGFLFKYISCPNHFSEMIQWLGFAIMANNLAAWSFFIWTCANLIPRAIKHHKWYKSHFKEYPKNRRALIPGII